MNVGWFVDGVTSLVLSAAMLIPGIIRTLRYVRNRDTLGSNYLGWCLVLLVGGGMFLVFGAVLISHGVAGI